MHRHSSWWCGYGRIDETPYNIPSAEQNQPKLHWKCISWIRIECAFKKQNQCGFSWKEFQIHQRSLIKSSSDINFIYTGTETFNEGQSTRHPASVTQWYISKVLWNFLIIILLFTIFSKSVIIYTKNYSIIIMKRTPQLSNHKPNTDASWKGYTVVSQTWYLPFVNTFDNIWSWTEESCTPQWVILQINSVKQEYSHSSRDAELFFNPWSCNMHATELLSNNLLQFNIKNLNWNYSVAMR